MNKLIIPFIMCSIPLFLIASSAEAEPEAQSSALSTTEVSISSADGMLGCNLQVTPIPKFRGWSWTTHIATAYVPESGLTWAGLLHETNLVSMGQSLVGFSYDSATARLESLISTNRHAVGLTNALPVLQSELAAYTNGVRRFEVGRQLMSLELLLGRDTVRDLIEADSGNGPIYGRCKPSELKTVMVEGTNAVVAIQFGTNLLAKIAFSKDMRPVWATTNGVSITPIPTSSVYYSDIISNQRVLKVIY